MPTRIALAILAEAMRWHCLFYFIGNCDFYRKLPPKPKTLRKWACPVCSFVCTAPEKYYIINIVRF